MIDTLELTDFYKKSSFGSLVGSSDVMQKLYSTIQQIASGDIAVLITGESGTGKELIAQSIHNLSSRADAPFVKVNCSALPDHLIESELFGYRKGAFTGASQNKPGKFEVAHTGTIFLDEVGEMSDYTQSKILRVLQEKEFDSLGSNVTIKVNVRVIAATNRNLRNMIRQGTFREDLYYRLNVFNVQAPPLRTRLSDIYELAEHISDKVVKRYNIEYKTLTESFLNSLFHYSWPGNVRELENVIIRAMVLGEEHICVEDNFDNREYKFINDAIADKQLLCMKYSKAKKILLDSFEKKYLSYYLEKHLGNIKRAAAETGMDRKNFYQKLKRQGIVVQKG